MAVSFGFGLVLRTGPHKAEDAEELILANAANLKSVKVKAAFALPGGDRVGVVGTSTHQKLALESHLLKGMHGIGLHSVSVEVLVVGGGN